MAPWKLGTERYTASAAGKAISISLPVVQTWQAWQLHDSKREESRTKVQNVVTDSTAKHKVWYAPAPNIP